MLKRILGFILINLSLLFAQDFTDIKIYINPGHGGNDSDDRYIAATGFWESEGNLTKGLYLRDILNSLNATTKISRTTNTTADDLGLSVISADANNFDADFFHSIHSNGFQGNANYTLLLYKETNGSPAFSEAKTMSDIMSNTIYQAHRTTTKYTRGDMSFLGFNLGVLRGLTMPGTLSEGSFHDYIPESWRLRNNSYLKHEAWAITKAFIDYYNLTSLPYGEVAGILRDPFDLVSYSYITSNDSKKPLNYGKAILMPDNIIASGDALNNGFFMFDEVQPGTYELILEAEDYERDTVASVVVTANKTTFVDRFLIKKPNYSPPVITIYSPSGTENVRLDSDIILEFDIKMNTTSVEQSFSLSPNVTGSFTWESNDRKMIFSPDDFLEGGTTYEISLTTGAKTAYDTFIEQPFSHTFTTRSALTLLSTYPDQNSTDISTSVKIKVKFDAPIDNSSLGGNVAVADMDGNDLAPYLDEEIDYENGYIIFGPDESLQYNTNYQIKLGKGITDVEGSVLSADTSIIFRTESNIIKEGLTIIDFEEIGDWWQPSQSGSTKDINTNSTSFNITSIRPYSGEKSGKLNYEFTKDSSGVCRVYNEGEPSLNSSANSMFGMWVFGDLSYNILEYWFRDGSETNISLTIDTLDWTGWKFKEVDLSAYTNLKFHSIVITQNKAGKKSGIIKFDEILTDILTDADITDYSVPTKFNLEQNYPNPFNPATTISYSIPRINNDFNRKVTLKVFDLLGREVVTLINKNQTAGNYKVSFDASNLPSGVYYYQLRAGDFDETKKMLLIK